MCQKYSWGRDRDFVEMHICLRWLLVDSLPSGRFATIAFAWFHLSVCKSITRPNSNHVISSTPSKWGHFMKKLASWLASTEQIFEHLNSLLLIIIHRSVLFHSIWTFYTISKQKVHWLSLIQHWQLHWINSIIVHIICPNTAAAGIAYDPNLSRED